MAFLASYKLLKTSNGVLSMEYLSLQDLYSYRGQGECQGSGGKGRYFCPLHQSDKQKSLILNEDSGWFYCFSCGAKGLIAEKKRSSITHRKTLPIKKVYRETRPNRHLDALLLQFEKNLVLGSLGERYLGKRGISLDLAREFRLGYMLPNSTNQSPYMPAARFGRIVFPHHDPNERILNLYSRAVGNHDEDKLKHHHLEGPKGIFNHQALRAQMVVICEGVFDALSCLSVGLPAVAIFGLTMDWSLVKSDNVLLAFDNDASGRKAIHQFGTWGLIGGKKVSYLSEKFFSGTKDLNELLIKEGPSKFRDMIAHEI